jgi:hypothetical protein
MALPIKPKDTQESCNPVSSNCVIWQGPDIPCINLCNGDSVSDVVAKLAERLCTITDQLDISLLDLSCFNPIYPTPEDFQDVIQFILNRICALENPTGDDTKVNTNCPDDCIVTIAPCFQEADFLGNLITTLPLKDYVTKIGNELCDIIATITANTNAIADLESRVTYIEDNCCNTGPVTIDITTTGCIGNGVTQNIENFLSTFETQFCNLEQISAGQDLQDAQDLLSNLCILGTEDQFTQLPASVDLSQITGWVPNPTSIADALNNLYLTVCDLRTYVGFTIPALIDTVATCCGASCTDIVWNVQGTGVDTSKWLLISVPGDPIPAGFNYCPTVGSSKITVTHMINTIPIPYNASVGTNDIISAINNSLIINHPSGLDITTPPSNAQFSIFFDVCVDLCVTDGTLECSSRRCVSFYNTSWCATLNPTITTNPSNQLVVTFQNVSATTGPNTTTYTLQVYNAAGSPIGNPIVVPGSTSSITWTSPTLATGINYYVKINSCQTSPILGTKCVECSTSTIGFTATP